MKKIIFLSLILSLFLAECGHGRTQYFPTEGSDNTHARITIVRSKYSFGAISAKIVLDGWIINYLKTTEYTKFYVPPGIHSTCIPNAPITMLFEKGKRYYFLIGHDPYSIGGNPFDCEQIRHETFEEMMKEKWLDGTEYKDLYEEQNPNLKETQ